MYNIYIYIKRKMIERKGEKEKVRERKRDSCVCENERTVREKTDKRIRSKTDEAWSPIPCSG